jgi:hypothetical protein
MDMVTPVGGTSYPLCASQPQSAEPGVTDGASELAR